MREGRRIGRLITEEQQRQIIEERFYGIFRKELTLDIQNVENLRQEPQFIGNFAFDYIKLEILQNMNSFKNLEQQLIQSSLKLDLKKTNKIMEEVYSELFNSNNLPFEEVLDSLLEESPLPISDQLIDQDKEELTNQNLYDQSQYIK